MSHGQGKPQNGQGNVREKSGNFVRAHGWTPCMRTWCVVLLYFQVKYQGHMGCSNFLPCLHSYLKCWPSVINSLRLRQNGCHFPDDIFKCIFKSPRYTGGDFMFLYRFVRRRRRPQILVHAITFEQLFGFISFLARLLALTCRLPE